MKKRIKIALIVVGALLVLTSAGWYAGTQSNYVAGLISEHEPGDVVDSLDGVYVYYNGAVGSTYGRNASPDGYNIGIKYQCVEFVKRYYYEHYGHRMPDPWGHALDFFSPRLKEGKYCERRGLNQYHNGMGMKPAKGDLIIFNRTAGNPYGHVAIVSAVSDGEIEIVQQNPGPGKPSRINIPLVEKDGKCKVDSPRVLGWLRMP